MKKTGVLSLVFLLCLAARSYDKKIDGMYYNLFPATAEAELTYGIDEAGSQIYYSKSVKIPETVMYNGVSYTVTAIGNGAFQFCNELVSVEIPAGVKKIGMSAFSNSSIQSVSIPNSVVSIGGKAFYECKGLTSIKFPTTLETVPEELCKGCTNLTSLSLPEGVKHINYMAFMDCTGLRSVTLPSSLQDISDDAFRGCINLPSITIPSSVKLIGNWAFYGCSKFKSVTLPEGIEDLWSQPFGMCTDVTSIVIPSTIHYDLYYTFEGCSSLRDVYCFMNPLTTNDLYETGHIIRTPIRFYGPFKDCPVEDATLHVLPMYIDVYKTMEPWSEFGQIVEIPEEMWPETVVTEVKKVEDSTILKKEYYSLDGTRHPTPQRGINIIRMNDGTTKKVLMK